MNKIPIFIINLEKDINKKKYMSKLCQKHLLKCNFTAAVDGKRLDNTELEKVYNQKCTIKKIGRKLSAGEIGCALSHKKIYQKMVDENIEKAIVLEDDIVFDNRIHDLLSLLDKFPDDWECVLLHYHRNNPFVKYYCVSLRNRINIGKGLKIVRFIDIMHSTGAYIINTAGAAKLLTSLNQGICKPIDHYTGDDNQLNLYGVYPRIIETDPIQDQQSTITKERKTVRSHDEKVSDDQLLYIEKLRSTLKKVGLHTLFKAINTKRLEILFYIYNFKKCIAKPKKYTNQS
jgi:glycosyl transferase family 25